MGKLNTATKADAALSSAGKHKHLAPTLCLKLKVAMDVCFGQILLSEKLSSYLDSNSKSVDVLLLFPGCRILGAVGSTELWQAPRHLKLISISFYRSCCRGCR